MANMVASGAKEKKGIRSSNKMRNSVYARQRKHTNANKLRACKRHVESNPNDSFGKEQFLKRLRTV